MTRQWSWKRISSISITAMFFAGVMVGCSAVGNGDDLESAMGRWAVCGYVCADGSKPDDNCDCPDPQGSPLYCDLRDGKVCKWWPNEWCTLCNSDQDTGSDTGSDTGTGTGSTSFIAICEDTSVGCDGPGSGSGSGSNTRNGPGNNTRNGPGNTSGGIFETGDGPSNDDDSDDGEAFDEMEDFSDESSDEDDSEAFMEVGYFGDAG